MLLLAHTQMHVCVNVYRSILKQVHCMFVFLWKTGTFYNAIRRQDAYLTSGSIKRIKNLICNWVSWENKKLAHKFILVHLHQKSQASRRYVIGRPVTKCISVIIALKSNIVPKTHDWRVSSHSGGLAETCRTLQMWRVIKSFPCFSLKGWFSFPSLLGKNTWLWCTFLVTLNRLNLMARYKDLRACMGPRLEFTCRAPFKQRNFFWQTVIQEPSLFLVTSWQMWVFRFSFVLWPKLLSVIFLLSSLP